MPQVDVMPTIATFAARITRLAGTLDRFTSILTRQRGRRRAEGEGRQGGRTMH